jgi:hypothetical protein
MNPNDEHYLAPCPRCKSESVEWTNFRDGNILESHIGCNNCDLLTFMVETVLMDDYTILPNLDYETTKIKYNAWAATNPKRYKWEQW